jgi:hypothetical protein
LDATVSRIVPIIVNTNKKVGFRPLRWSDLQITLYRVPGGCGQFFEIPLALMTATLRGILPVRRASRVGTRGGGLMRLPAVCRDGALDGPTPIRGGPLLLRGAHFPPLNGAGFENPQAYVYQCLSGINRLDTAVRPVIRCPSIGQDAFGLRHTLHAGDRLVRSRSSHFRFQELMPWLLHLT